MSGSSAKDKEKPSSKNEIFRLDQAQPMKDNLDSPKSEAHRRSPRGGRSILVLINPHSGRGRAVSIYRGKFLPVLATHGIDHHVFITDSEARVTDYIHQRTLLELLNLKSIVVVSGDGLLYEVVNALMSRDDWEQAITVPIGIIPSGSGNGLAYTLVKNDHPDLISKDEAVKICCEQAIQDDVSLTDLIKITYGRGAKVWSFLSLGWGLLADIDVDSDWLRCLGELRFTIYGLLRSLTSVSYRGKLSFKAASSSGTVSSSSKSHDHKSKEEFDDKWTHIEDTFACLYAVYQSHISRATKFAPKSTLADQMIYLTYIRGSLSPFKVVEFLLSIKDGSHETLSYVNVVPVTEFTFQPLESSKIVVDGEIIPWSPSDGPVAAQIMPNRLKLQWKSRSG